MITFGNKSQSGPYDPSKWNAQDANEVKTVVNDNLTHIYSDRTSNSIFSKNTIIKQLSFNKLFVPGTKVDVEASFETENGAEFGVAIVLGSSSTIQVAVIPVQEPDTSVYKYNLKFSIIGLKEGSNPKIIINCSLDKRKYNPSFNFVLLPVDSYFQDISGGDLAGEQSGYVNQSIVISTTGNHTDTKVVTIQQISITKFSNI